MMLFTDAMYTLEGRLASFKVAQPGPKRRTSSRRGSALKAQVAQGWPHATPSAEQLAKAGFVYAPTPDSPDNAACFLCQKSLDGWEAEDDPVLEHLHHSPECGWAVIASIMHKREDSAHTPDDPMSDTMKEARRATFAGKWPHDGKKGWVCNTEKMVNGGWYYCPTSESDDFVSCAYCSLSVDGWEPKDKPLDEHRNGAPNCPFFTLSKPASARKKSSRASRAGRTSTTSRLSTQSNFTAISEAPTLASLDADEGDSIMSTATGISTVPASKKKGGKAKTKKAATGTKGKKGRPKKEEPAALSDMVEPEDDDFEIKVQTKAAKETKGKKRKSDEMDIDEITLPIKKVMREPVIEVEAAPAEASPQPKSTRRATKTRTKATEDAPKPRKKAAPKAKATKQPDPAPVQPPREVTPPPAPLSPQTSDAENQPPSVISRSSMIHSTQKSRTPLATGTPISSRLNANLMDVFDPEPTLKWTTTDLEAVFLKSPSSRRSGEQDKENMGAHSLDDAIQGVKGALTSPEKKMTVEEWISFNAEVGEKRLRADCERLVGLFEKEGNRALQALEGIPIGGR